MSTQKPTPQLVEKTSKRYKLICAIGSLLMVVGAVLCAVIMRTFESDFGDTIAAVVGFTIAGAGLVMVLVGSALAWWHHA